MVGRYHDILRLLHYVCLFFLCPSPKFTPVPLGGCYRIMFVFFPRRISFVRQCLIKKYTSPTTRDGSTSSNDASRKPVSPRMQEKPTKITWRIRELSFSSNTALFLIDFILYRPLQGLILAIKDPKVAIFAIMTVSELLGLSFLQFFPTLEYVLLNYKCSIFSWLVSHRRLTQTLGFSTTATLLLTAYAVFIW